MKLILIEGMRERHLPEVRDIYNREIRTGVATLDQTEQTLNQRKEWFYKNPYNFPRLIAIQGEEVVGFAYLSTFREKEACRKTAEVTLYIRPDKQGSGIGSQLLDALITQAQKQGFHTLVSVITEGNQSSIRLHEKFNFRFCGSLQEVGFKHNQWVHISFYQKHLANGQCTNECI